MVKIQQPQPDYYATIGGILHLLQQSPYHRRHAVGPYIKDEILPAVHGGQYRLFFSAEGATVALLTWAWITKPIEQDIHQTGRALFFDEWQSGERLFFNDFICPFSNPLKLIKNELKGVFKDVKRASAIRRGPDGQVKRISIWRNARVQFVNPTTRKVA